MSRAETRRLLSSFTYIRMTRLIERLHRRHLDMLRFELDRLGIDGISAARGGLLLWVQARDNTHQERAKAILSRHSAHDVHIHAI